MYGGIGDGAYVGLADGVIIPGILASNFLSANGKCNI